jgi:cytochrome c oxidase cbb3-type subunit 3
MTLRRLAGQAASFARRRPLSLIVALLVLAGSAAGWAAYDGWRTASLLRADPDQLPAQASLTAFAVARGRAGFARYCASCHGRDGRGDPSAGVPNLTDHDWLYGDGKVSEIEGVVLYGVRAPNARTWKLASMPAYARRTPYPPEPALQALSPGDIDDVIAFLFTIEGRQAASHASRRGQAIFSGRGGCYDCHAPDAHGDPGVGAPNLADAIWLYGAGRPRDVFDSIAYGRAGVCPAWAGRLKPGPIREIAFFVHSLPTPTASGGRPA